jgi:ribokinase
VDNQPIVVIGSLNIDLISVTPRLPRPGETVLGKSFHMAAGGKGANQAVAAARLGAPVAMVGRVGDDPFARLVRDEMTAAGVDIERVLTEPSAFTATGSIFVDASGQNSIVVSAGANARLTPNDVVASAPVLDRAALVILQLEIPLRTNEAALEAARRRKVPVILNAAPMDVAASALIAACDWLVVNEIEAEQLVGREVRDAADAVVAAESMQRPQQRIVITLGAGGAVLVYENQSCHVPAPVVDVVDTTAAGDAFVGALGAVLQRGGGDDDALRRAVLAGSLACTKMGAIPSLPTADQVQALRAR